MHGHGFYLSIQRTTSNEDKTPAAAAGNSCKATAAAREHRSNGLCTGPTTGDEPSVHPYKTRRGNQGHPHAPHKSAATTVCQKTAARPPFTAQSTLQPHLVKVDEGLRAGEKASQVLPQVGQKARVSFPAQLQGTAIGRQMRREQRSESVRCYHMHRARQQSVQSCNLPRACVNSDTTITTTKTATEKKNTAATAAAAAEQAARETPNQPGPPPRTIKRFTRKSGHQYASKGLR